MLSELLAYWHRKRGTRWAPARADIDPVEIPKHLANIHLVEVLGDGQDFRYRLIGTQIVEGAGRDFTGKRFSEVYGDAPDVLRAMLERYCIVVREKRPIFTRGNIWWAADRQHHRYAGATLPLSEDGERVTMILSELVVF